jgi:hypothetical protein
MNNTELKNKAWTIQKLEGGLGIYKEAWDRLNAELYASNPYFDSNFIEPLLAYFATGKERLCVHRRGADVDGLVIISPYNLGKWSLFLQDQVQIAPILLRCPENLKSLLYSLRGFSLGLDLPCQDSMYSPLPDALESLLWKPVPHAHTISVSLNGNFEEYFASRSKGFRYNIKRRFKKVKEAGVTIRIKRVTEFEEMQAAVSRFGNIETMGWKGVSGTAVHADNIQGKFYTDVMKNFAKLGKACIYELYFDNTLVAMELCIASSHMLILLKTTHDESQSSFSPGRLLLYLLLEDQFLTKWVKKVEFYTNADINELAWATHDRWINHYLLFRNKHIRLIYKKIKQLF